MRLPRKKIAKRLAKRLVGSEIDPNLARLANALNACKACIPIWCAW